MKICFSCGKTWYSCCKMKPLCIIWLLFVVFFQSRYEFNTGWPWGYLVLQCTCWEIQGCLKRSHELIQEVHAYRKTFSIIAKESFFCIKMFFSDQLSGDLAPQSVAGWKNQFLWFQTQKHWMQHCCHSTDCYFRQQHSYQCLDFLVKGLTFVVDTLREKYLFGRMCKCCEC